MEIWVYAIVCLVTLDRPEKYVVSINYDVQIAPRQAGGKTNKPCGVAVKNSKCRDVMNLKGIV